MKEKDRKIRNVEKGVYVVEEIDALDIYTTNEAKSTWQELINGGYHLILNLSGTTCFQAEAITAIIQTYKLAQERERRCGIIASTQVNRVISVLPPMPIDCFPPIYETEAAALAAMA